MGPEQNCFLEPLGDPNVAMGNLSAIGTFTQARAGTSKLSLQALCTVNELRDYISEMCDLVITFNQNLSHNSETA
jgi:hypothetical protein